MSARPVIADRVGNKVSGAGRRQWAMPGGRSDLRVFLRWCHDQDLDPLAAARIDIERYVRWLQGRGLLNTTVWGDGTVSTIVIRADRLLGSHLEPSHDDGVESSDL
jgi:hypothetical protein